MARVVYFISKSGDNPVYTFLQSIEKRDRVKFFRIFQNLEEYGMDSIVPHVKKITNYPLWEIRVLGSSNLRILYALRLEETIIVLHGFRKKQQKTPGRELDIALKRLKEYQNET